MPILRDTLSNIDKHLLKILGSIPKKPIVEGKYTRWGKGYECWAIKRENRINFGNWKEGIKSTLFDSAVTDVFIRDPKKEKEKEKSELIQKAAKIKKRWGDVDEYSCDCGYFAKKGLSFPRKSWINIKYAGTHNLIPYYSYELGLCGIQTIDANGTKRFMEGSTLTGAFVCITDGKMLSKKYILMVEGVATGLSVYVMMQQIVTDIAVIIVGSCSNYIAVYSDIKRRYEGTIIVIGENGPNNKLINYGIPHIIFNPKDFGTEKTDFDANDAYVIDKTKAITILKDSYSWNI